MNGRDEMNAYAKLVAGSKFKAGDKVVMGANKTVLTVVEPGDPLVRCVTPHGVGLRAGWKTLAHIKDETHG